MGLLFRFTEWKKQTCNSQAIICLTDFKICKQILLTPQKCKKAWWATVFCIRMEKGECTGEPEMRKRVEKINMVVVLINREENVMSTECNNIESHFYLWEYSLISHEDSLSDIITVARFQEVETLKNLEDNTTLSSAITFKSWLWMKLKYYIKKKKCFVKNAIHLRKHSSWHSQPLVETPNNSPPNETNKRKKRSWFWTAKPLETICQTLITKSLSSLAHWNRKTWSLVNNGLCDYRIQRDGSALVYQTKRWPRCGDELFLFQSIVSWFRKKSI